MAGRPLQGLLVVSLEQALAAPMASCRLADAGARVIKVERPGAGDFARGYDSVVDGESAYFVWANRGKESIALDLTRPEDAALLHRILAGADVFIQNLGPGAAARAGFGDAALRAAHPRLITCAISGYGPQGPYAGMRAYDLLVQAESGIASVTGTPEAPGRIGVSACDVAAGLAAHAAILEALLQRAITSEGSAIHVSMFAAMAEWMAVPLLHHAYRGTIWPRVGLSHPLIAPYGAFPAGDGQLVLVGVQNDAEWQRLAEGVLRRPDLAAREELRANTGRVKHRAEVDAAVAAWLGGRMADAAIAELTAAGIACARVNDVAGLARHPQLEMMPVATPAGEVMVPVPPARHADAPLSTGRVPALDADGATIRAEFTA
ncbi:CoA transferase [Belnapia sp. T6]|uniref:CoA transferase n=1 Tax=Belnapia mucosa TaxID=2804532 RepID=A0ABS1V3R2_9PROT|nr:CaiB/BaiF CoA-transferase family protein [Belnapia mucosa]MBL6456333.1 CoA transferase [Belnapia mucosa]